jgi:hypothetical protein
MGCISRQRLSSCSMLCSTNSTPRLAARSLPTCMPPFAAHRVGRRVLLCRDPLGPQGDVVAVGDARDGLRDRVDGVQEGVHQPADALLRLGLLGHGDAEILSTATESAASAASRGSSPHERRELMPESLSAFTMAVVAEPRSAATSWSTEANCLTSESLGQSEERVG